MNIDNIVVRKLTPADLDRLQEISISTFINAFAADNTDENMQLYIKDAFNKDSLLNELNNPESIFYFALSREKIVGYLKLNTAAAQTDLQSENALEIARIYIDAAFQGQGIGKKLLDKTIDIALQKSVDFIWLGVWERNLGAIRFYERNGFEKHSTHVFMLGTDLQKDIIMKRRLR